MAEARTAEREDAATAYLEAYGRMLLIRLFEQAMHKLFLEGEVHGTTHVCSQPLSANRAVLMPAPVSSVRDSAPTVASIISSTCGAICHGSRSPVSLLRWTPGGFASSPGRSTGGKYA